MTRLPHKAKRCARRRISSLPPQYQATSTTPSPIAMGNPIESDRLGTLQSRSGMNARETLL